MEKRKRKKRKKKKKEEFYSTWQCKNEWCKHCKMLSFLNVKEIGANGMHL